MEERKLFKRKDEGNFGYEIRCEVIRAEPAWLRETSYYTTVFRCATNSSPEQILFKDLDMAEIHQMRTTLRGKAFIDLGITKRKERAELKELIREAGSEVWLEWNSDFTDYHPLS